MKKIMIIFVILVIGTGISFGQRTPLLPYNNNGYGLKDIKNLALGGSEKSVAFKNYLVEKLKNLLKDTMNFSAENLTWALQEKFMFCEERTLKAGEYENSGFDIRDKKIAFFTGESFTGFVWIFRIGTYEVIICKANCANPLNVFKKKEIEKPVVIVQPKVVYQEAIVVQQPVQTVYVVRTGVTFIPDNANYGYGYSYGYGYRQNVYAVRTGVSYYSSNYGGYGYCHNRDRGHVYRHR